MPEAPLLWVVQDNIFYDNLVGNMLRDDVKQRSSYLNTG